MTVIKFSDLVKIVSNYIMSSGNKTSRIENEFKTRQQIIKDQLITSE